MHARVATSVNKCRVVGASDRRRGLRSFASFSESSCTV
jgi:hypothetical protein